MAPSGKQYLDLVRGTGLGGKVLAEVLSTGAAVALAAEHQAASVDPSTPRRTMPPSSAVRQPWPRCYPALGFIGMAATRWARGLNEASAAVALATNFQPSRYTHPQHAGDCSVGVLSHGHDSGGNHFGGHHQRRSRPCLCRYRRFARGWQICRRAHPEYFRLPRTGSSFRQETTCCTPLLSAARSSGKRAK